jgi:predicted PurR-regulated permease PerM
MTEVNQSANNIATTKIVIDIAIRLILIALLGYWCLLIFLPFLVPVLWGIIIAVAIYPLYLKLESLLGGRKKLALTLFTLFALSILITPTVLLTISMADTAHYLAKGLQAGTLQIPPPPENIAGWPIIGEPLHNIWSSASKNLMATIEEHAPQLKVAGKWLFTTVAGAGGSVLQFIFSIIIAAIFIANADVDNRFAQTLSARLAGKGSKDFSELAGATMRSVAQGVLGVAFIQGVLAGVGLMAMGVPGAGFWALLVLFLAIMQLPPLLVLGPIIIYVFSVENTVPAVIFMIWSLLVGISDNILKPMLLGRGVEIPMLIILIGAIGGMILLGLLGLFIGAVVLALGYELFTAWLYQDQTDR